MEKDKLIPNRSYETFILGDSISNYLYLPYRIESHDDPYIYYNTCLLYTSPSPRDCS